MSGRALLRLALVTLVLLVIQSTLMLSIRIHGVHPDLLWLVPITAAILDGPETGAIAGFWSGLAFDLILPTPFGLSALVGCILGYAVGSATKAVDREAGWLLPVAAVIGSVAADMLFAVLGGIFGQRQMVQIDFTDLVGGRRRLERPPRPPGQLGDAMGPVPRRDFPIIGLGAQHQEPTMVRRSLRHPIRGDRRYPKPPRQPREGRSARGNDSRACGPAGARVSPGWSVRPRRRPPVPTSDSASSGSPCSCSSASSWCACGPCR